MTDNYLYVNSNDDVCKEIKQSQTIFETEQYRISVVSMCLDGRVGSF